MNDSVQVSIAERPIQLAAFDNTPESITITDHTRNETVILEQKTEVIINGVTLAPEVTINHGGTRGPIYVPGSNLGRNEILAYLIDGIEQSHLNTVLNTKIDESTTGLAEARVDLDQLITEAADLFDRVDGMETNITQTDAAITQVASRTTHLEEDSLGLTTRVEQAETTITQTADNISLLATRVTAVEDGDIEALQTQISQSADDITLAAARLDTAENNIFNAQIQLDANAIRLTVAEEMLDGPSGSIVSQIEQLSNQITLRVQEDAVNGPYFIGMGAVLYPDWSDQGVLYEFDKHVWRNGETYKALYEHTSTALNDPELDPTTWELVPGGVKSQIGFDAAQIYFRTQTDGTKRTLLVAEGDNLYLNGNLISNGMITAPMIAANQVFTVSVQSPNYVAGTSGFKINAATGYAEFNSFTLKMTALSSLSANLGTITAGQINFGSFTGYAWPAAGLWGAHLSASGLLLGNYNNGQYIQITNTGCLYAPGISLANGNATFSGTLAANIVSTNQLVVGGVTTEKIGASQVTEHAVVTYGPTTYNLRKNTTIALASFSINCVAGGYVNLRLFNVSTKSGLVPGDPDTYLSPTLYVHCSNGANLYTPEMLHQPGAGLFTYTIYATIGEYDETSWYGYAKIYGCTLLANSFKR